MRQRGFTTKRDAVNYALRKAAIIPMSHEEMRAFIAEGIEFDDLKQDEVDEFEPWDIADGVEEDLAALIASRDRKRGAA